MKYLFLVVDGFSFKEKKSAEALKIMIKNKYPKTWVEIKEVRE